MGCVWWWKAMIFKWHWWDYYCTLGHLADSSRETIRPPHAKRVVRLAFAVRFDAFKFSDNVFRVCCTSSDISEVMWGMGESDYVHVKVFQIFPIWGKKPNVRLYCIVFPDNYFQCLWMRSSIPLPFFILKHCETVQNYLFSLLNWLVMHCFFQNIP